MFPSLLILLASFGTAAGLKAADAAPVEVVSATPGEAAASYRFTGTITARQRAQLSPRLPGLVENADFEVGDHFEPGQTLLRLDPTLAEIELGLREADVALAANELEDAERLLEEANRLGDPGFPRSERLTRATKPWKPPPAEYLPEGEEAKIFTFVGAPPGYNLSTMEAITEDLLPPPHRRFLTLGLSPHYSHDRAHRHRRRHWGALDAEPGRHLSPRIRLRR